MITICCKVKCLEKYIASGHTCTLLNELKEISMLKKNESGGLPGIGRGDQAGSGLVQIVVLINNLINYLSN